jgi:hypothetical protein
MECGHNITEFYQKNSQLPVDISGLRCSYHDAGCKTHVHVTKILKQGHHPKELRGMILWMYACVYAQEQAKKGKSVCLKCFGKSKGTGTAKDHAEIFTFWKSAKNSIPFYTFIKNYVTTLRPIDLVEFKEETTLASCDRCNHLVCTNGKCSAFMEDPIGNGHVALTERGYKYVPCNSVGKLGWLKKTKFASIYDKALPLFRDWGDEKDVDQVSTRLNTMKQLLMQKFPDEAMHVVGLSILCLFRIKEKADATRKNIVFCPSCGVFNVKNQCNWVKCCRYNFCNYCHKGGSALTEGEHYLSVDGNERQKHIWGSPLNQGSGSISPDALKKLVHENVELLCKNYLDLRSSAI